ncbi:ATP-grasp domain-containing protein [Alphaproteobacteria bacterium]|nr:ATP-grasp domain-containing protein [Alphaproteobacteria bacterium]
MDEVGFFLKSYEPSLNCEVVYSEQHTSIILRRKSTTYKALQEYVSVPKIYSPELVNDEDFPLFLKPDIGHGSRGATVVYSVLDLQEKLARGEFQYILSEYLPGDELTIDCFSNLESNILFAGPRQRNRVKMGISVSTQPIEITKKISEMAICISKVLKLTGCWFFQIKADVSGKYKLLEVAARVAGSMALYRKLGVNFILLDIYQRMGVEVSIPEIIPGNFKLERSLDARVVGDIEIDSVYVDLDDCIIVKNAVNTDLVAFLYACRNKGLPITLVTRHQGNLSSTLTKYRLSGLFDRQFHLKNGESKHVVVTHTRPLFIDDSFEERKSMELIPLAISMSPDMVDIGMFL